MPSTALLSTSKWLACTAPAGENFDTGATNVKCTYKVPFAKGILRKVEFFLPPGSAGGLHLIPYVVGRSTGRTSPIDFGEGGDQYFSGEQVQGFGFDCAFPVYVGDVIEAWYDNTDASNAHWFGVSVTFVPEPVS